jgi:hypothetical protein
MVNIFAYQKSQFWDIFQAQGMKMLGIHTLSPFGIFCGHLVYIFSHFGMLYQENCYILYFSYLFHNI